MGHELIIVKLLVIELIFGLVQPISDLILLIKLLLFISLIIQLFESMAL